MAALRWPDWFLNCQLLEYIAHYDGYPLLKCRFVSRWVAPRSVRMHTQSPAVVWSFVSSPMGCVCLCVCMCCVCRDLLLFMIDVKKNGDEYQMLWTSDGTEKVSQPPRNTHPTTHHTTPNTPHSFIPASLPWPPVRCLRWLVQYNHLLEVPANHLQAHCQCLFLRIRPMGGDKSSTEADALMQIDLKGSVPLWLVNNCGWMASLKFLNFVKASFYEKTGGGWFGIVSKTPTDAHITPSTHTHTHTQTDRQRALAQQRDVYLCVCV